MWRLLGLFGIFAGPAFGQAFQTGNELLEKCSGANVNYCIGYLAGAYDTHTSLMEINDLEPYYCMPNRVTHGQLTDIYVQWLEGNPQERHYSADSTFTLAMMDAFPCE